MGVLERDAVGLDGIAQDEERVAAVLACVFTFAVLLAARKLARDPQAARLLWEISEQATGVRYP